MSLAYKLLGGLLLMLAVASGSFYAGHHQEAQVMAEALAKIQAADATALSKAEASARAIEQSKATSFNAVEATYVQDNARPFQSFAASLPAAVTAGTLQLRYAPTCPSANGMSAVTAHSRALDAAATQALADSVKNSIAAVQAGDETDARERQLDNQIVGLQNLLVIERSTTPTSQ